MSSSVRKKKVRRLATKRGSEPIDVNVRDTRIKKFALMEVNLNPDAKLKHLKMQQRFFALPIEQLTIIRASYAS